MKGVDWANQLFLNITPNERYSGIRKFSFIWYRCFSYAATYIIWTILHKKHEAVKLEVKEHGKFTAHYTPS